VAVLQMHLDAGLITSMTGDGGNDCGALRLAHCGLAMSEAEASVVSPFTTSMGSATALVDIFLEGRATLATSFAAYKFLISYGLYFSILKLLSYYWSVLLSNATYFLVDALAVTAVTGTTVLALPLRYLANARPSHSLLSYSTVMSCLGAGRRRNAWPPVRCRNLLSRSAP